MIAQLLPIVHVRAICIARALVPAPGTHAICHLYALARAHIHTMVLAYRVNTYVHATTRCDLR